MFYSAVFGWLLQSSGFDCEPLEKEVSGKKIPPIPLSFVKLIPISLLTVSPSCLRVAPGEGRFSTDELSADWRRHSLFAGTYMGGSWFIGLDAFKWLEHNGFPSVSAVRGKKKNMTNLAGLPFNALSFSFTLNWIVTAACVPAVQRCVTHQNSEKVNSKTSWETCICKI